MAVDAVGHRHVHVIVNHVAAHCGNVWAVTLHCRRVHRVGCAVFVCLAVLGRGSHAFWCNVRDGQQVAVDGEVGRIGDSFGSHDNQRVGGAGVVPFCLRVLISELVFTTV